MDKRNVLAFKLACQTYFNGVGLDALRTYGRFLQLKEPTKRKKAELIQEIIAVLCGEIIAQRTKRGAPVKNVYVEPQILQTVQALRKQYGLNCGIEEEKTEKQEEPACEAEKDKAVKQEDGGEDMDCNVSLCLTIRPSALTAVQKKRLNDFLNSL